MMPDPILPANHLPEWIVASGAIGTFVFGSIYKVFNLHRDVKDHGGRIGVIEEKCEEVENHVHSAMTVDDHAAQCSKNNHFMCDKVKEVKSIVQEGHEALAHRMDKMDLIRDAAIGEAVKRDIKIATLLGRVEEHLDRGK